MPMLIVAALFCFAGLSAPSRAQHRAAEAAPADGAAGYTIACAVRDDDKSLPRVHGCADLETAQRCMHSGDFVSRPSQERTGITVVNRSNVALRLYWLDFQGNWRLYHIVTPGGRIQQNTFIGHNWLVASIDDQCIGVFNAAPISIAFF
jgi:VHL beta domain